MHIGHLQRIGFGSVVAPDASVLPMGAEIDLTDTSVTAALAAFQQQAVATVAQVEDIYAKMYAAYLALDAKYESLGNKIAVLVTVDELNAANNALQSWRGVEQDWAGRLPALNERVSAGFTSGKIADEDQAAVQKWFDTAAVLAKTGASTASMVRDDASVTAIKQWAKYAIPGLAAAWDALVAAAVKVGLDILNKVIKPIVDAVIPPWVWYGAVAMLAAIVWTRYGGSSPSRGYGALSGSRRRINGTLVIRGTR